MLNLILPRSSKPSTFTCTTSPSLTTSSVLLTRVGANSLSAAEEKPYVNNVIQLTDEIIPIETISLQGNQQSFVQQSFSGNTSASSNPMYPDPQPATSPYKMSPNTENPFGRLESEIAASVSPAQTLSAEDLLNQLATPLIKNWLDQNLRKIVEGIVEKEIERMRRS
jgi:cell pole-organizing protein PopZ